MKYDCIGICPRCGKHRKFTTDNIPNFVFKCFVCGKSTKVKGKQYNISFQVLT
jgi:uncharacterized protein (DUF983 family)